MKERAKYVFRKRQDSNDLNNFDQPEKNTSFYQLCSFANPNNNLYNARKFIINEKNEITSVKDFKLTKKQFEKLLKIKKPHQYKSYPTYTFKQVEYPSMGDILMLKSDILSTSHNYTGFAPF